MKLSYYPTVLFLEDGKYFKGWSFSPSWFSIGEVVFNTGMTGYQEVITDPSYANQMIVFTYPEIGNTGVNKIDYESKSIYAKGIISKNLCDLPSNWQSMYSLKQYVVQFNIPHIFGIDTRSLTRHLRKYGVMLGCISSKILDLSKIQSFINLKIIHSMNHVDLINYITIKQPYEWINQHNLLTLNSYINHSIVNTSRKINIVVIDFGVKNNILSRLKTYDCNLTILPAFSNLASILKYKPNGILLSNGPGDPASVKYAHIVIQQLIYFTNIPIFGICMGHQILSYAQGGSTFKLKFGHRGLNHPSGIQQIVEVTSQNHGFAVNADTIDNVFITHQNLNDLTIAGLRYLKKPIFSVQYHPEASPGPHDADYLFQAFIQLIKEIENNTSTVQFA